MGQKFQILIILKVFLQLGHVDRHDWANGLATGEKEICDINLPFKVFTANAVTVLIDQVKLAYVMVPANVLNGIIHQPRVDVHGIVDWQHCFWFHQKIENRNKYQGKEKQKY
jgi:hypothetical protein